MEEIRSLALFYKVERGGGSSWGVAARRVAPLQNLISPNGSGV